ncbi:MAG: hypothetical protein PHF86_14700 [Candidatus Nanoarchaeia archaeon]|nr:hypothetical protein [Candidatus Nanoarchaeia archaeon]
MKVINVAGFDVKIEKNGNVYMVLNDGKLHYLPDECLYDDNFQGLLRVVIPPVNAQKVINSNEIVSNKTIDFAEPVVKEIREIELQSLEENEKKVLKGVKLKKETRIKLHRTKNTSSKKEVIKETNTVEELNNGNSN